MKENKKLIILALVLLVAVFGVLTACKGLKEGDGETVVVTDENGVPITDENGEAMTVVLQTKVVEVTNENGEKVYDENGKVKTSVVYIPQEVGIPVTDENGQPVTDTDGNRITTMITVPPSTNGPATGFAPVTDGNGEYVTDENGETVTEVITSPGTPATPGSNNADWGAAFGGSGNDNFVDTVALSDGSFVALMHSNSKDGSLSALSGNSETPIPVLIKYKKNGTVAWQKAISSDSGIVVSGLAVDNKDNIAVSGYTKSKNLGFTNAGDYDAVLFKFNDRGDMQWQQNFGGSMTDGFEAVAATPDGGFAVIGYSSSSDGTGASLGLSPSHSASILVKYNADGNLQFMKSFGSTGDALTDLAIDKNGDIYTVGNFSSRDDYKLFAGFGRTDAAILKLSANGDILWTKQYGGSNVENFPAITIATDGGCVIAGRSRSKDHDLASLSNQGNADAVLVKFNEDGTLAWERGFRGYAEDSFTDIAPLPDGGYAAVGYSGSSNRDLKPIGNRGGLDGFVVTVTQAGRVNSVQGYGGSLDDRFNALCILKNGQIIACGATRSADGDLVGSSVKSDGKNTVGMIARFN